MRVTVIFEDRTIGVDDVFYEFDAVDGHPNYTALQWYGEHGTIEVKYGDRVWLDSVDTVQPFIAQWSERHAQMLEMQVETTVPHLQGGPTIVAI